MYSENVNRAIDKVNNNSNLRIKYDLPIFLKYESKERIYTKYEKDEISSDMIFGIYILDEAENRKYEFLVWDFNKDKVSFQIIDFGNSIYNKDF